MCVVFIVFFKFVFDVVSGRWLKIYLFYIKEYIDRKFNSVFGFGFLGWFYN